MNNTISVIIPEGYEFKQFADPILSNGGGALTVLLKKKNTKDFDFYVDEYLRSDDCTTNEMMCNWFNSFEIETLKGYFKTNKFVHIPWEIKIGLACFIAKDFGYEKSTFLFHLYSKPMAKEFIQRVSDICPDGFIATLRI